VAGAAAAHAGLLNDGGQAIVVNRKALSECHLMPLGCTIAETNRTVSLFS
jgi:hypothetical protein